MGRFQKKIAEFADFITDFTDDYFGLPGRKKRGTCLVKTYATPYQRNL
jgi:hypothetical protein